MRFHNSKLTCATVALGLTVIAGGCAEPKVRSTDTSESIVSKGLDVQDFTGAASETTNQMAVSGRIQDTLARIKSQLPPSQLPLIKISRIRNDTVQKINLVDYFVTPIESVLLNSGKVDSFSEDKQSQSLAAGQDILNGTQPRLADL